MLVFFSSEWLIVFFCSSGWLLSAFNARSLLLPVSPSIRSIVVNDLLCSFQASTGCCLPKYWTGTLQKYLRICISCEMFKILYYTRSRICRGQRPTDSPAILAWCQNSLSDFNELCWSSLHRYTSLLGRQRSAAESIILSFLSWRCESMSVKSPSIFVTFPLDLSSASLTLLWRPPPKNWISFKEVSDAWEEYNSSIAPVLLLTFKKKKKVWKMLLPRIPPAARVFSRITFFQFGISPAVRICKWTGWTIIRHHVVAQQMWQGSRGGDISHLVFKIYSPCTTCMRTQRLYWPFIQSKWKYQQYFTQNEL